MKHYLGSVRFNLTNRYPVDYPVTVSAGNWQTAVSRAVAKAVKILAGNHPRCRTDGISVNLYLQREKREG